jgi:hypothetical protein
VAISEEGYVRLKISSKYAESIANAIEDMEEELGSV